MKNLLFLLLLTPAFHVFGQNRYLGVTSGILLSNHNMRSSLNSDDRSAFAGGLTFSYLLNNKITFGADLLYLQRGFRDNVTFTDQS